MSSKSKDKDNKKTGPAVKTVRKPIKVLPTAGLQYEYQADKRIADAFTVHVIGPTGGRSLTYHRPIGFTELGDEDWVLSPSTEVPSLLARAEHPHAKRIEELRAKARNQLAVGKGLASQPVPDGPLHYPDGSDRTGVLSAAHSAAKEAAKAAGQLKVVPGAFLQHLPPEKRDAEVALSDFLKSDEARIAVEQRIPLPAYETLSGPFEDQKQAPVAWLKELKPQAAQDAVLKVLRSGPGTAGG
ncbi:MAG: hypothetical protein [Sclerotinia sclerotiorum narnavirus 1]|nr:MAG: hypothetical protein [Sclerotinia sclerotiorum narnavirus 1]